MNKLISIIIPVYNHSNILEKSINSLIKQIYRPIEIIIINDGSTDNFENVIKGIIVNVEKEGVEIKIINQKNQGASSARNQGFRESKGEYVIFWDADTIAKKEMLEVMCINLEGNSHASFVYSGFKFGFKKFKCLSFNKERLNKFNYIDITSLIKRKDLLEISDKGGPFDESLKKFQDWDLWLTLTKKEKIGVCISKILYKKITKGRAGISFWLPKFFYKLPIQSRHLKIYQKAKEIIYKKHQIK